MWIMAPFGILMLADRGAANVPEGDPRTLQVRARRSIDLDRFRQEYCPELGETIPTPERDYNCRAYCTPAQFSAAMTIMVAAIDYEKFKPTTDRYPEGGALLHSVYNSIWGTVCRLGTPWEAFSGHDPAWAEYRSPRSRYGRTTADDAVSRLSLALDDEDNGFWDAHDRTQAERRGSILFGETKVKGKSAGESKRARKRRQRAGAPKASTKGHSSGG